MGNKFLKLIDWENVLYQSGILKDVEDIKRKSDKDFKMRELRMKNF